MVNELWQAFIQFTAAVNAILLGGALLLGRRLHHTRSRQKLGWALIAYGYLLVSFTAKDNLWLPVTSWFLSSDYFIALTASALFIDYVAGSLRRRNLSRLIYLPPFAFVAVALVLGEGFVLGPAINFVVILQIAYTCLTTWIFVRSSSGLVNRPRHLFLLLVGLWILHVFQFGRMLLPGVGWLFDIVPLIGAVIFLAFTVLVLTDPRAMRTLRQLNTGADLSKDRTAAIENYMLVEQPYLDIRLSLERLADGLDIPPRELSQVIGASPNGSFYNFVNRFRVDEARRLLCDPAEARTSVEAIGLMSGFRSRSTFYEAFRRETGMTPAQYRRAREASGNVSD
ncbi:MAG: helix-turn-helix transcriptional regulator [Gammaproteobacteria bacterium]|nr:helix-turn-helix transcriptional regulator [Gammaproteobacteria bacterium]MDH4315973.1 helix-turn-helix transcriptional regulator [Gammaproteobacteria bacterium]